MFLKHQTSDLIQKLERISLSRAQGMNRVKYFQLLGQTLREKQIEKYI